MPTLEVIQEHQEQSVWSGCQRPDHKDSQRYGDTSLIRNNLSPQDHHRPRLGPSVGSWGGVVAYEGGTPVQEDVFESDLVQNFQYMT